MKNILIVEARFYPEISDLLLKGAIAALKENNINFEIATLSGALEIPALIAIAAQSNKYDGFIALGCVMRGETSHYDIVANESARAIMNLTIEKNIAIGNGILTVENYDQAIVRADPKQNNKGEFAVKACLEIIKFKEEILA